MARANSTEVRSLWVWSIGPILQTQKLLDSILFARTNGRTKPLTACELELMNFTGDGNGFDMVSMPQELRDKVPTSNFFQRGGYERNPVAIRHNTVAKLLAVTDARMDSNSNNAGAREMAGCRAAAAGSPLRSGCAGGAGPTRMGMRRDSHDTD